MVRWRSAWTAGLILIVCLAVPASAGAATLSGNPGSIQYTAAAGEANTLTVERVGNDYRFTDAVGITITPSGTCTAVGNVGTCPGAELFQISAVLNDQNDTATAASSLPANIDVNLFGQEGNDTLSSTAASETQLSGDDFGGPPGNDILVGGPGPEFLGGGPGNDSMVGGDGDDRFGLDLGNDTLNGGPGDDNFSSFRTTSEGVDLVTGGPGDDRVDLRNRTDDLHIDLDGAPDDGAGCPGPGCEGDNYPADVEDLDTGGGNDVLIGSDGPNQLGSEGGNDLIQGLGGSDSLQDFGESDDRLEGGSGGDSFFGGEGADAVLGGAGDDTFSYEFFDDDTDNFSGGAGFDSVGGLEDDEEGIRVSLNGQADDGFRAPLFSNPKDNIGADIEDVTGSQGSDLLVGSKRPNQLSGQDGRDRLIGRAGQDALLGDRGRDSLVGGKARDSLDGGGGPDRINSRDGRPDEVRCGSSIDRVKADRADRFGPDCDKVSLKGRR